MPNSSCVHTHEDIEQLLAVDILSAVLQSVTMESARHFMRVATALRRAETVSLATE